MRLRHYKHGATPLYKQSTWIMRSRTLWPLLWSSGQSSWLQIQRSGFDSRRYQILWEVVRLERGPLTLVSTTEELLERKNSDSSLENREYGRRHPSRRPRGTLYQQMLALTSPTSGGRSVCIVRSWTQAMEFLEEHYTDIFLPWVLFLWHQDYCFKMWQRMKFH
jgi:hypothetical protein